MNVDQFYGIEIGEFPTHIAETALWMMDHIMNNRLSLEFGQTFVRIPLTQSPHILHADALETDWNELLSPENCSYVFGNPPFGGQSYQSKEQREQMRRLTNPHGRTASPLDYVGAWFLKAGAYVTGAARLGFVSTNSITQGEQVALLWPRLFDEYKLEIAFAHRTFAWGSDVRGKAHVHVVILGLDRRENVRAEKRLFSYPNLNGDPEETRHTALSPYLFDASGLTNSRQTVREESQPINGFPKLTIGSMPIDGGHYIFTADERAVFLAGEPDATPFLRPYVGAREYIRGGERWILTLQDAGPADLKALPKVVERMRGGEDVSRSKQTQEHLGDCRLSGTVRWRSHPDRAVSGYPRGEFGAAGICADRLVGATNDSKQSCPNHRERYEAAVRFADLRHTHELVTIYRRAVEERLPLTPSAWCTTPSPRHPRARTCQNWNRWPKPYSTPAPLIPARHWPTCTTPT